MGPAYASGGCYTEHRATAPEAVDRSSARARARSTGHGDLGMHGESSAARPRAGRPAERSCSGSDAVSNDEELATEGQASRVALIRAASAGRCRARRRSARPARSRTRLIEPKTRSSARLRVGPTPGRSSNADRTLRLGPHLAVVGDREAMRLVAQSLDEVERRRRGRQHDRLGPAGQEELLALLGQAGQRQVVQPELVEDLPGGADLARAAVDDDEVGQRASAAPRPPSSPVRARPEAAPEDLLVAGEVVRALDRPDPEAPVLAGARPAVLEDDHAADRVAALDGADVVALDAQSAARQARAPRPAPRARPSVLPSSASQRACSRASVSAAFRVGERHELALLAALGHAEVDRSAAARRSGTPRASAASATAPARGPRAGPSRRGRSTA